MLAGHPPFFADNPLGIYEAILGGKIEWPRCVEGLAKDLIRKLLVADRTKRIGCLRNGAEDVKTHKWLKEIDWEDVLCRKLKPPFVPKFKFDGDTSNFDDYGEEGFEKAAKVSERETKLFEDF